MRNADSPVNAASTCIAGTEYQRVATQTVVHQVLLLMQIDISFARMEVYECGAMLLALLAYDFTWLWRELGVGDERR